MGQPLPGEHGCDCTVARISERAACRENDKSVFLLRASAALALIHIKAQETGGSSLTAMLHGKVAARMALTAGSHMHCQMAGRSMRLLLKSRIVARLSLNLRTLQNLLAFQRLVAALPTTELSTLMPVMHIAKVLKDLQLRFNTCLYPSWARSLSSSSVALAMATGLACSNGSARLCVLTAASKVSRDANVAVGMGMIQAYMP